MELSDETRELGWLTGETPNHNEMENRQMAFNRDRVNGPQHTNMYLSDKDPEFVPLTARELNDYAKRLQRNDRNLSWRDAQELARKHDQERIEAHVQNVSHRKDR